MVAKPDRTWLALLLTVALAACSHLHPVQNSEPLVTLPEYVPMYAPDSDAKVQDKFYRQCNELYDLRKKADYVFELVDFSSVYVVESKMDLKPADPQIPIKDFQKWFQSAPKNHRSFVIILLPQMMDCSPGDPAPEQFYAEIESILKRNGVRQIMMQADFHGLIVEEPEWRVDAHR